MLVIAGTISIDPQKRDAAIGAAVEMMEETRKEAGCISYTFSSDLLEEGLIHVFEEWASQEALDGHFTAPHMKAFQVAAAGLGVREMNIQRYDVSAVAPLRG